ncbi:MAG: metallophosphoesterase [Prevotellaceae bacterium]|jgi:predicted phosphodiesterase|nr:metallophosphoesterase [Prevotellaceae bacterium]
MRNKKIIYFVLILLPLFLQTNRLAAQEFVSARIVCGPWIQAAGETEFTVVWETTAPAVSWVEVAPNDSSHFYACERTKYYESVYGRRPVNTLHTVKITGLTKGTAYRYRIYQQALLLNEGNKRMIFGEASGNDLLEHRGYAVTTLNAARPECRFSMLNDIHGNDSLFRNLTKDILRHKNNFMIFNGDMLSQIESPQQIRNGYLKSAGESFAPFLPVYAVRGNHEYRGAASYDYMRYFPTSTGQPYYTFRDGPAFFIALDCGEDKPDSDIRYDGLSLTGRLREEQAAWLKKVVASDEFKAAPVKIVILHMPPAWKDSNWHGMKEIARLFMPILNEAGIDLMLCGHLHRYLFLEKGEAGNSFPILINANQTRVDAVVDSRRIHLSVVDAGGKILHARIINSKLTF